MLLECMQKVRQEIRNVRLKQLGMMQARRLIEQGGSLKLDLGCGPQKRSGFIGIDFREGADIVWDIGWGIPFRDNCVDEIRSDHFLEHLALPLVVEVLRECRRCLIPGGILNLTVPHFDPYLDAYIRHDYSFLAACRRSPTRMVNFGHEQKIQNT